MNKRLISVICTILLLVMLVTPVIASVVTNAEWEGIVRVSNNGSATATNTSAILSINSTWFYNNGFCNADYDDIAIQIDGTDTAFMPGYVGYPWALWSPSVTGYGSIDYDIYSSNVTGGKIRYFPADAGMTTDDDATIEGSDNFTYAISGYVDTDNGTDKYLVEKQDAISVYVSPTVSGNITAAIGSNLPDATELATDYATMTAESTSAGNATYTIADDITGSSYWETNAALPEYLMADFVTSQYQIVSYTLQAGVSENDRMPKDWTFQGSPDNSNWTTLDTQTGITFALSEKKTYTISNTKGYRYYRWNVSAVTGGGAVRIFEVELFSQTVSVTATGVSSGEHDIDINGSADSDTWATGDILHFDGTATSNLDCGVINSDIPKLWINLWFKLDTTYDSTAAGFYYIYRKAADANNWIAIYLYNGDGMMRWQQGDGVGGLQYDLQSSTNSWSANTWYHIICSLSDTNPSQRMIINNIAEDTDNQTAINTPNGGNVIVGNFSDGGTNGIVGEIKNLIVGIDDLSPVEETDLFNGIAPGDETDYWYIDEGTGTAITSYGSLASAATADTACTWETSTYTTGKSGRLCDFTLIVDGATGRTGVNYIGKGGSVPDNDNDYVSFQNNVMPYVESQTITVGGTQVQAIEWEYGATFTDSTGNSNDATPTFRSASSNAYVSAALASFIPAQQAKLSSFDLTELTAIISGTPTEPGNMYGELDFTYMEPADPINDVLDASGTPQALWWFPVIYISIGILGFIAYGATRIGGANGSLFTMCIIIEICIAVIGIVGIVPYWPALLFPIPAAAIVISQKHFSWG